MLNYMEMFSTSNPGQIEFSGQQNWVYYLFGAIFLIACFVCIFFAFKFKDSKKEYEHIAHMYGQTKKFWLLNRFFLMIMLSVITFICAIIFFLFNGYILQGA